jgi:hypothetical protein
MTTDRTSLSHWDSYSRRPQCGYSVRSWGHVWIGRTYRPSEISRTGQAVLHMRPFSMCRLRTLPWTPWVYDSVGLRLGLRGYIWTRLDFCDIRSDSLYAFVLCTAWPGSNVLLLGRQVFQILMSSNLNKCAPNCRGPPGEGEKGTAVCGPAV